MLKMYQEQSSSGSSSEFWDACWEPRQLAEFLADARVVENDPIYPLLVEKLRPEGLFLEGGCGPAQLVKYFSDRRYRVVGVDFAERTIERLRQVAPELDLRVADIMALPFADGEVHSYYSGGVVEHIESGPEPALDEARRVLADDGWFLCSVPDASSLRQRLFARGRTDRHDLEPSLVVTRVAHTVAEPPPDGLEFFQYAFTTEEFTKLLENAGFTVDHTFGYNFIWGLMEVPGFRAVHDTALALARSLRDRLRPPTREPSSAPVTPSISAPPMLATPGEGGFWRRALLKEDRTTPLLGPLIDYACEHTASMRMYVARPAPRR